MTRPKEKPLTPGSLATDGNQGPSAAALGHCVAKHSLKPATTLTLALYAMDAARAQLDRYANGTDAPAWGVVEAADLLDTARAVMTGEVTP